MSTTPEPMSEERLAQIEAAGVLNGYGHDLLAEVRRLRKCKQEDWCPGVPVACQKHVDQERQKLLDAHGVIDELLNTREELRTQAEELLAQVKELRVMLGVFLSFPSIQELAGPKLTQDAARAYARTPAAALELQRARRAAVEAAKAFTDPTTDAWQTAPRLRAALDALEKLEASAVEAPKNTTSENGGSRS